MRTTNRLASVALLTAGLYLSASLWCVAPARAQDQPGARTGEGSEARPIDSGGRTGLPSLSRPSPGTFYDVGPQEEAVDAATYIVGPGDQLVLHFWGRQNFSHRLQVDSQGRIFINNVGFVPAMGITLAALEKSVLARVKQTYPRLNAGLTLVRPRSFVVQVAGLVKVPDAYHATALTRVSRIIQLAGGRAPGGSQSKIEVRRQGKVITANLQPFYLKGDRSQNPFVIEGDVVYVPPSDFEVMVAGGVYRPGSYELDGDRTLGELFRLAGGLTPSASAKVAVLAVRRGPDDDVVSLRWPPARSAEAKGMRLQHGDRVFVPTVDDVQRRVIVQGAIAAGSQAAAATGPDKRMDSASTAPREFTVALPYYDGDTARTVLERVGGLLPWADARNAFVERRDAEGKTKRIQLEANALLVLRDLTNDVPLMAGDVVYVPAEREGIMVSGPVWRPGLYQHSPRYTALDYVALAGGTTPNGTTSGAKVITKSGKQVPVDKATTLSPGDTVAVKPKTLTTFEWVQILLTVSSIVLSATAITITLKR
ncbi:MAG: SLBB domain-containing protein [Deltaproteobacteria bacterium]|nr:SLBB domain-containing protein [Deltaproteobacteria bacterium]